MAIPLPGELYFDRTNFGGHFFIVGPEDPCDESNVVVFYCTSKQHDRDHPHTSACLVNHNLPAFFLPPDTLQSLPKPTWIKLDEPSYICKQRFESERAFQKNKRDALPIKLTVALLRCGAESVCMPRMDAAACTRLANLMESV